MEDFKYLAPVAAEATRTQARSSGFTETNIKAELPDGYWIEAFPFRTKPLESEGPVGPELISSGLGVMGKDGPIKADVRMHLNPYNEMKK